MTAGLITEIVLGGVFLASLTYFVTKATVKRKIISKIDFMSDALDSGESAFRYSERRWADRRLNKSLNRLRSIFEAEKKDISAISEQCLTMSRAVWSYWTARKWTIPMAWH